MEESFEDLDVFDHRIHGVILHIIGIIQEIVKPVIIDVIPGSRVEVFREPVQVPEEHTILADAVRRIMRQAFAPFDLLRRIAGSWRSAEWIESPRPVAS